MMLHFAWMRHAGFTLIEIMIVIAIIAILAGIVVPNFMQARAEAQLEACKKNILTLATALQMAEARCGGTAALAKQMRKNSGLRTSDEGGLTVDTASGKTTRNYLIDYGYVEKWPQCPAGIDSSSTGYAYNVEVFSLRAPSSQYSDVVCLRHHYLGDSRVYLRYVVTPLNTATDENDRGKLGWSISTTPYEDSGID